MNFKFGSKISGHKIIKTGKKPLGDKKPSGDTTSKDSKRGD